MKQKQIILLLLAIPFLCSCKTDKPLIITSHSFILGFYEFDNIEVSANWVNIDDITYARLDIYFPKARMITDVFGKRTSENGTYYDLCRQHNDISYPTRKLNYNVNAGLVCLHCYPKTDFSSLEVSPKEGARFVGVSVHPYIQNGYKPFNYGSYTPSPLFKDLYKGLVDERPWYPIDKEVQDISAEDLMLLGIGVVSEPGGVEHNEPDIVYPQPNQYLFSIYFPKCDTTDNEMILNITLSNRDGKVFNVSKSLKVY